VAWFLDRQYLLGGDLLVAPVFEESGKVQYYLPKGRWTRWFDTEDGGTAGETVQGPIWLSERYGFMGLPLFVKEGAILLLGKEGESRVEYDYLAELEIRLYHVGDKAERILVDVEGKVMGRITVDRGKIEVPEVVKSCTVVDQDGKIWLRR
jgi:alpha-D-xyloside xylohydrolase